MTGPAVTSDADLLLAWSGGDRRAGNELIERHFAAVYRFVCAKLDDGTDDLVLVRTDVLRNRTTDENIGQGGGIWSSHSNVVIEDSTIDGNVATSLGGGIHNSETQSQLDTNLTISGSTISNNIAGLTGSGGATLIDVREASEWEQGHIVGARHISKSYIEQEVEAAAPDHDRPVILYCAGGIRSLFAARTLQEMGFAHVVSLREGWTGWTSRGYPVES